MDCTNTYLIKETSGCSKDEESESGLNPFLELPEDVIANILHRLGAYQILVNAQRVCSSWRNICRDPSMWRFVDMKHLGDYKNLASMGYDNYLESICRRAIDRSQGQLTELHIDHFASDELLEYISERSSKLKCLQIRGCYDVEDVLIEVANKLPLLEELHFVCVLDVHDSIEPIGQSWPKLKSFTLSSSDYKDRPFWHEYYDCYNNREALAIAKSMPGLHHLRLVGNNMTNKGLQAILDGCPNLESLDIRRCFNVDLHGEIGDRIAQKIKDFKRPNDPMEEGCVWDADIFYYDDYWDGYSYTDY